MLEPMAMDRDINVHFAEFIEEILINFRNPLVVDPYTNEAIRENIIQIRLPVSWKDITARGLEMGIEGALLGVLTAGDAVAIYQGQIDINKFHLPNNSVTRNGVQYVIEKVVNPSESRWVLMLKRLK